MLEEELTDLGVLALVSLTKETPQVSEDHGWVVGKEVAHGRGKVDLHFDGGEVR